MTSSVCLDAVTPQCFVPQVFLALSRRLARPQVLFLANALVTLIALGTLEMMVQGTEHVSYAETAFSIDTMQPAPTAFAGLTP
jgi:hypothetical protein